MRQLILIICSVLFISCEKNNDTIEIYNLMISELGTIPKLKPTRNNLQYNLKLDSLNKQQDLNLKVGILNSKIGSEKNILI